MRNAHDHKRCPSCTTLIKARETCCEACLARRRQEAVAKAGPEEPPGGWKREYLGQRMPSRCGKCDACLGRTGDMVVGPLRIKSDCSVPKDIGGFIVPSRASSR